MTGNLGSCVRVAAYQAPLVPDASRLERIRAQVRRCEREGVEILRCPEAYLGGLADDTASPERFAIRVGEGELDIRMAPLASHLVTTIAGFTEITASGQLHNAAVVFHRGTVAGVYVVEDARRVDITLAQQLGVHVVRADVAGRLGDRISCGSSAIVSSDAAILRTARRLSDDLLIADLNQTDASPP